MRKQLAATIVSVLALAAAALTVGAGTAGSMVCETCVTESGTTLPPCDASRDQQEYTFYGDRWVCWGGHWYRVY